MSSPQSKPGFTPLHGLLCLLSFAIFTPAPAAEWSLDPTWGGTGQVLTPLGGSDRRTCVAVQPDGKVLAAGTGLRGGEQPIVLARYTADGVLDPSWGEGGTAFARFLGGRTSAVSVLVQPDGRVVVAGTSYVHSNSIVVVARFGADGKLDPAFNGTGMAMLQLPGDDNWSAAAALQPDGKVIVLFSCTPFSTSAFGVARWTADGRLDPDWGGGAGYVATDFTEGNISPLSIGVRADGNVTVVGRILEWPIRRIALARYRPDGAPDPTFHTTGKWLTFSQFDVMASCAASQPDGRILLGGETSGNDAGHLAVDRLNEDGTPDSSFTPPRFGLESKEPLYGAATGLAVATDGQIIAKGRSSSGYLILFRCGPSGRWQGYQYRSCYLYGYGEYDGVAVQADGRILVPGWVVGSDERSRLATLRFREQAATDPPQLYEPAPESVHRNPLLVDFDLPESSTVDSPSLTFDDGNRVRTFPLNVRRYSAGKHRFQITAADPVGSSGGAIDKGEPIPDGIYTVSVAYRDRQKNPPAMTSSARVTIDNTPPLLDLSPLVVEATSYNGARVTYESRASDNLDPSPKVAYSPPSGRLFSIGERIVTVTGTDAAGNRSAGSFTVTVVDTTPPAIAARAGDYETRLTVPQGQTTLLPDYLTQSVVSDLVRVAFIEQSPPAGTVVGEGVTDVTLRAGDAAGNVAERHLQIEVRVAGSAVLAATGAGVPGAGIDPQLPNGAMWRTFGVPSISAKGKNAGWRATVWVPARRGRADMPAQRFQGVFSGPIGAPTLRLRTGEPLAEAGGAVLESLREPVFAGDDFAVVAKPHAAPEGHGAELWAGVSGALRRIAHEGSMAPGTRARFNAFTSVAMPAPGIVFFVAKLAAPAASDMGLWVWTEANGLRLCLREGDPIEPGGLVLKTFAALTDVKGSPGHGRYDADMRTLDVLLTLVDIGAAIARVDASGNVTVIRKVGDAAGDGTLFTVGVPSSPGHGLVNVTSLAGIDVDSPYGDYVEAGVFDHALHQFRAQRGYPAPGAKPQWFTSFLEPVAGLDANGEPVQAFIANLYGLPPGSDTGVWAFTTNGLKLVARAGDEAIDRDGAPALGVKWTAFTSLSALEGRGVIFTAALASDAASASRSRDAGLWATSSDGKLRLVLRVGDVIEGKTLRSFDVLGAVAGSPGQRRTWTSGDPSARVIYRVFFTDGSSAIVSTAVP